jgi:hypothetical protein
MYSVRVATRHLHYFKVQQDCYYHSLLYAIIYICQLEGLGNSNSSYYKMSLYINIS